jgi:hypothetical protein
MRHEGVRQRDGGPLYALYRWDEEASLAWWWDPWGRGWVPDDDLAFELIFSGDVEPVAEDDLEEAKAQVRAVADGSLDVWDEV